jgi:hypothetical protein
MWGIRSASSSSSIWPWRFIGFAAVHRHRLWASPSRSRPRGSICSGSISLGLLPPFSAPAMVSPPPRQLDGVCNPGVFSRCGVVLGRLAVGTVLLSCRRSPWDGYVATPQPWLRRQCRCHDHLLAPVRAHLWVLLLLPLSMHSLLGGLASEPGMLAYCCYAMLDLVSRL